MGKPKVVGDATLRLASAVRKARNQAGLSYVDLAVKAGMEVQSTIAYLEQNHNTLFETAAKLAVALDLDLNKIIKGEYREDGTCICCGQLCGH